MSAGHIVEIFGRILGTPEVNTNSDFFELGGDSLLANIKATGLPFESLSVPGSDRRRLLILGRPAAEDQFFLVPKVVE